MNCVHRVNWFALGVLLFCARAVALPDSLTITATNSWTKQPVVFNLQRYNLRGTNYQVRVYSDATTFTLLPTNQIPEVTTYRGRITGDPGAIVVGSFGPDGKFYYNVSYGCRWQENSNEADSYDTTNRLSWGGWGASVATTNIPIIGNYVYAYQTNMPQHINWSSNNYPASSAVSYGGPPLLNNFKQVPAQRVRIMQEMDQDVFINTCGGNTNYAILMQESRINEMDYIMARDYGVCYQIVCVCLRPNSNAPFTSAGNSRLGDLQNYWSVDPGYSHGNFGNGWFDMAQVSLRMGGGVAYAPGDFAATDPGFNGNVQGHENGHNWGAADYVTGLDYTGDNKYHCSHTGSGYCYGTDEAMAAVNLRKASWKSGYEWVKYNGQISPRATPDMAVTGAGLPVSINVLLNDYIANSNALSVASFETNTPGGGTVTNLGNGILQYTPTNGFVGYDMFHYYVTEAGGLKSLTGVRVLVTNAAAPLLAAWSFDQTNGSTVVESTGHGPAATLFGTANFGSGSVPGVGGGRALHLDGSGYARFKGTWFDPLNASISISIWVRPDATPTGTQMIFMKSDNDWNRESGLQIGMTPSTVFVCGSTFGSSFGGFKTTANIVPQAGVWYHIVAELDRSSNLSRLFVNGTEYTSGSRSVPAGEFIFGENWPIIGAANATHGWNSYFVGTVDDLRLYTKALSASEVTALYQGGGILPAAGPRPVNGENNVVFQPTLTWQPGGATNFVFKIFIGTNAASVAAATTNSAEYKGQSSVASFNVTSALAAGMTYYWRVDEVYGGGTTVSSEVWSFSTAIDSFHAALRLYLSLDSRDTVGTNTYDRAAEPYHDGILYNSPTLTSGEVYEGMNFNGTSAYVETPALNLNTSNATFMAWINSAGAQSSYAGILFCRGGTTVSGLDMRGTSGQLGYHWNNEGGTYNFASNLNPPTNQWALAVLTVQNNRAIFYLGTTNGVLKSATNNYTHVLQAFDAPMDVASDSTGGRNFNGSIDEVGIWSRVLSAAEIGQILTNGINGLSFGGPRPAADPNTFTWTGNSDVYWTNPLNWASNGIPGSGDTVYFNDSADGNTSTQLGSDFSISSVSVSGGIRGVAIGGANTLTIGSGGVLVSNTTATLTIGAPLSFGTTQSWSVSDQGAVSVTGPIANNGLGLALNDNGSVSLSGVMTGSGGLTHNGSGTLSLGAANTFSGPVVVNSGDLVSTVSCWYSPRGIGSGSFTVNTGATAEFTATHGFGADAGGRSATLNGGTMQFDKENYVSGLTVTGGSLIGAGELRTPGNVTYTFNASANPSLVGCDVNLVSGSVTFNVANGGADPDLTVAGVIFGSGGGGHVIKNGAGSLLLTKPATYTGNTTNNQGTMNLSGADNILPVATRVILAAGTTLNLNGINQAVAGLTGSGAMNLGSGSFTDSEAGTNTFGGVITGAPNGVSPTDYQTAPPGGIAMAGTGKLTLTGVQTYTGDTWISSGTLALSGSGSVASSSNLIVSSGARLDASARTDGTLRLAAGQTLSGFGSVLGKVVVTNNSIISPGNIVIGTLTLNSTLNLGGGQAWMALGKSGGVPANDFVTGVTTLTYGGSLVVTNTGTDALTAGDSFKLFNATSYTGSFSNFSLPSLGTNLVWDVSKLGVNGTISVSPAIQPPVINGGAVLTGGGVQFSFSGPSGQTYKILGATNISMPMTNWVVLTNGAFGAGPAVFIDSAPTKPAGFYRVVSP